jgi:hypothetical protein
MYIYNHSQIGGSTESDCPDRTILTATYSFDRQVPPNAIGGVSERCWLRYTEKLVGNNPADYRYEETKGLAWFITEVLGYQELNPKSNNILKREFQRGQEKVEVAVKRGFFSLDIKLGSAIKLKSEARGHQPLEGMIDLQAIDDFVRFGKTDYRREPEQESQRELVQTAS